MNGRLVHGAAHLLLDRVVADRGRRRPWRLVMSCSVMLGEDRLPVGVVGLGGVLGPDAGVAVGLQFEPHREPFGWPGRAALRAPAPRCRAGPGRGGRTRGPARTAGRTRPLAAELAGQLVVERQVDVDVVVLGAVERADAAVGRAAAGVRPTAVKNTVLARLVLLAEGLRQGVLPVRLDRVDVERVAAVDVVAGSAIARPSSPAGSPPPVEPPPISELAADQPADHEQGQDDQADVRRRRRGGIGMPPQPLPPPPPPEPAGTDLAYQRPGDLSESSTGALGFGASHPGLTR